MSSSCQIQCGSTTACQKVSSSSILHRPRLGLNLTWPLREEKYRESTSKGAEVASKKVAKWYQSFWVVSVCYYHPLVRLTDTTKDRKYVWAMSHDFTWESQGSCKGHQQIWGGPCVCTKMTYGKLKNGDYRCAHGYDMTFYLGRSRC